GGSEDDSTAEELPKPEEQRMPYRNPYRGVGSSNRFRGGGGGGGDGYRNSLNSASPSYDPSDVYKSMTMNLENHKNNYDSLGSSTNRAGYTSGGSSSSNKYSSSSGSSSSSLNSRDDYGYDDLASKG
ncbi:unnamed protein product, partial [Meganyctiphanes norvegica]